MTNQPGNKMNQMNRLVTAMALFLATIMGTPAQELAESLRKGLFEEQANRDLNAAIEHYQAVIEAADAQRHIVATALYRLAESYRKQGKEEQAKEIYGRLSREFSDQAELISQIPSEFIPSQQITPEADNFAALERLLRNSPDLLNAPATTNTLAFLQHAAMTGNVPMTKFLLERGADPNIRSAHQPSPLHLAVRNGHLKVAQLLLQSGADVNAPDLGGNPPLHNAAGKGYLQIAEMLLEHGAEVEAEQHLPGSKTEGETALHEAAADGFVDMSELLLKHGANVNARKRAAGNSNGPTPLHEAAAHGKVEEINLLLKHGADIHAIDEFTGSTPLHYAARQEPPAAAAMLALLKAGADPNAGGLGTDTLSQAVLWELYPVIDALLQNGVDPNMTPNPSSGRTLLHSAVQRGNSELAQIALKHGADPNAQDVYKVSSLHYAAGAPFTGRNPENVDSLELTKILLEGGADPNKHGFRGYTPLHYAASPEIAKALLEHGANVNAQAERNVTPLDLHSRTPAIAELIQAAGGTNSVPQDSESNPVTGKEAVVPAATLHFDLQTKANP